MRALFLTLHASFFYVVAVAGVLTLLAGITLLVAQRGQKAAGTSGAMVALGNQHPLIQRTFRMLLTLTAAIGVLQAAFGGVLYLYGDRPADQLHFVYGGIVLIAIPVAYVYSDQKQVRRDIIIMTIAAVAIVGAAVRAFMTGQGVGH